MFEDKKYLSKVILNTDVYAICTHHALTTEKEEVMGLLIGHVDEVKCISHISACTILRRLDKQPDRVEISPEQLLNAATYAETLSQRLDKTLRVVGWYHSHPHITVWPSHVDVRTQALYQTMDPFFVGLIFSVYPKNTGSCDNQIQLTVFQSQCVLGSEPQRLEIPIQIIKSPLEVHNLEAITTLPNILVQEEIENYEDNNDCDDLLINLHNDSLKTLKHVHIASKLTRPMCEDLEARLKANENRIEELKLIKERLLDGQVV